MKPSHSNDHKKPAPRDQKPKATPVKEASKEPPVSERRGRHRVADDQQSGSGSQSALSKLMMIERKRAALLPSKE
jgi:hypothetical protein